MNQFIFGAAATASALTMGIALGALKSPPVPGDGDVKTMKGHVVEMGAYLRNEWKKGMPSSAAGASTSRSAVGSTSETYPEGGIPSTPKSPPEGGTTTTRPPAASPSVSTGSFGDDTFYVFVEDGMLGGEDAFVILSSGAGGTGSSDVRPHVGHNVEVEGRCWKRGGLSGIDVTRVTMLSEKPADTKKTP
jgi:hypothetical protein